MKSATALPVLVLLLAGCATQFPEFVTAYHPVTGLRSDLMQGNILPGGPSARDVVWLDALRVFRSDTSYYYYLDVTYAAPRQAGYLDIKAGPTLRVEADGKSLVFSGDGSRLDRRIGGGLSGERATYLVQPDDLRAIASAQKLTVQVTGKNGTVTREFALSNGDRFKKFVAKFVPPR